MLSFTHDNHPYTKKNIIFINLFIKTLNSLLTCIYANTIFAICSKKQTPYRGKSDLIFINNYITFLNG